MPPTVHRRSINTYIRGTSEGYVCQQADQQTSYPSRDQALQADAQMQAAWEGLKAGIVAVKQRRFAAEPHDLTPQCRVYSGVVPVREAEARLSIFTELDAEGNETKTMAVQVTLPAAPSGDGLIDFWSGHPRETRLVDQALARSAEMARRAVKFRA